MACVNVEGTWEPGRLIVDGTGTLLTDPVLNLAPPDNQGVFEGAFDSEGTFRGRCSNDGPQPTITFTRIHPDGMTITVYRGKVTLIAAINRAFLRGKFTRVRVGGPLNAGNVDATTGDWETEKPT
jgi:hypothetical protein